MDHYDLIVIGSGPGGGSLAHRLAATGKRILMIERGDYLPRSRDNWDSKTVFVDGAYQATGDVVRVPTAASSTPGCTTIVGGNSKVYGAALFRLRERDFERDPAQGRRIARLAAVKYQDFEPFYTRPRSCSSCTASAARTRWSRRPRAPTPIHRFLHEPRVQQP